MYLANLEIEIGGLLSWDILNLFTTVLANLDSARLAKKLLNKKNTYAQKQKLIQCSKPEEITTKTKAQDVAESLTRKASPTTSRTRSWTQGPCGCCVQCVFHRLSSQFPLFRMFV
jgi:hypothetical protein